jgi:quinol monooxygenase YgiN
MTSAGRHVVLLSPFLVLAAPLQEDPQSSTRQGVKRGQRSRVSPRHESSSTRIDMIVGTLRILPALDRRAEVLEVFRAIQGPVLAQPGCTACHIYEEQGPEPAVVLVERWESQAALEAHLRSETYRRILGAVELSGGPPEVCFDYVSSSEGMDLIERSRTPGGTTAGR